MAIYGSVVGRAPSFDADLKKLVPPYPEIEAAIDELEEFLKLDYIIPEIAVDSEKMPRVYAVRLDYPPMKAGGRSRFLVTYHATDPDPSMRTPYRSFTLLTINERPNRSGTKAPPNDPDEAAKAEVDQPADLKLGVK